MKLKKQINKKKKNETKTEFVKQTPMQPRDRLKKKYWKNFYRW